MSLSNLKLSRNISFLIGLLISIGIGVVYNNADLSKVDDKLGLIAVIVNLMFWSVWALNSAKVQEVEAILNQRPNLRTAAIRSSQFALYSLASLTLCLLCVVIATICLS